MGPPIRHSRRKNRCVDKDVDVNRQTMKEILGESIDVVYYAFRPGAVSNVEALLVYIEGLCDRSFISEQVIAPVIACGREAALTRANAAAHLTRALVTAVHTQTGESFGEAVSAVLRGDAALFVSGSDRVLIIDAHRPPARALDRPDTEVTVRGPHDSFNEVLETTTALIRRRIKHPDLRVERFVIGDKSRTAVALLYVHGIVDPSLVDEARTRLNRIEIDAVLDVGVLDEYIGHQPYPLFPVILPTERPDRVASALLEGKLAIAADGSPVVSILPVSFWDFFLSPSDYYQGPLLTTFIRWLRILAFVIALVLPSFYVTLTTFHHEMIPTGLALQIAAGREGTPLPAVLETLFLEIQFEIVREAGLRIPGKIGTAVSIVGVLVVGQALVAAGVVSPIIIIVVGSTAIASFAVPIYAMASPTRLLRFPLIVLSGTLGIFGLVWGIGIILVYLASLKSFGRPYLAPLSPLRTHELTDSPLMRAPLWMHIQRRAVARADNRRRQAQGQKPRGRGDIA